jgi:hypothetical protein
VKAAGDSFFLNQHRLDPKAPHQTGVREIWLSRTPADRPYDYLDLDKAEHWLPTPEAEEFAPLMAFVKSLPFKALGRILIIYDDQGHAVPAHRDHPDEEICHEFIWMRTNFNKPFYVLNADTKQKLYVASHSAWFDTVNQFHGADASQGLSFSIRVDGSFNDALRAQIPYPAKRRSMAPALFATAAVPAI